MFVSPSHGALGLSPICHSIIYWSFSINLASNDIYHECPQNVCVVLIIQCILPPTRVYSNTKREIIKHNLHRPG